MTETGATAQRGAQSSVALRRGRGRRRGEGERTCDDVRVSDWGHMGHYLRGQVTFPVIEAARGRVLGVTIRGIGGDQQLGLGWRMPRTR